MYEKRVMKVSMVSHVTHILCNQRKMSLENGVKKGVYNIHICALFVYIENNE